MEVKTGLTGTLAKIIEPQEQKVFLLLNDQGELSTSQVATHFAITNDEAKCILDNLGYKKYGVIDCNYHSKERGFLWMPWKGTTIISDTAPNAITEPKGDDICKWYPGKQISYDMQILMIRIVVLLYPKKTFALKGFCKQLNAGKTAVACALEDMTLKSILCGTTRRDQFDWYIWTINYNNDRYKKFLARENEILPYLTEKLRIVNTKNVQ